MGVACTFCSVNANKKLEWNPITVFLSKFKVDELMEEWDQAELENLSQSLKLKGETVITQPEFLKLFPKLQKYSSNTKSRYYSLFNYSQTGRLKSSELVRSLTIIKQSQDTQLISEAIFYVYLEKSLSTLSYKEYNLFIQQNQDKVSTQASKPTVNNHDSISKKEFSNIFIRSYQCECFIEIFSPEAKDEDEKQLATLIQQTGEFGFNYGDVIYLVEYNWFLNWKEYLEKKYKVGISPKNEKSVIMKKSQVFSKKSQILDLNHQGATKELKRPGMIKNGALMGDRSNQLKSHLVQFHDYALLPKRIWDLAYRIYGGYPEIMRKYPNIYALNVIQVFVDDMGEFEYIEPRKIPQIYRESKISDIYSLDKKLYLKRCYYKYPGKQNWDPIPDLQRTFESLLSNSTLFICFVPKGACDRFQSHYNFVKKGYIEKRVKNYGSIINVSIQGVIHKGVVTQIWEQKVRLEYRNAQGLYLSKLFPVKNLKTFNPSSLTKENRINFLAGMSNFENNCYMNSVVQCIIRTPSFGNYLQSVGETTNSDSLLNALKDVFIESKEKELIDMQKFKKKLEYHFSLYIGHNQQDAQEFLTYLMMNISKEISQLRQYEKKNKKNTTVVSKLSLSSDASNPIISKFFCGIQFARNTCTKCPYTNQMESQFYTYSLSLAEKNLSEFEYYLVNAEKKNWVPRKCMITLPAQASTQEFIEGIKKNYKISDDLFDVYSFGQGRLEQKFASTRSNKKLSHYESFAMKIVVFRKKSQTKQSIELRFRVPDQKKNIFGSSQADFQEISLPLLLQVTEKTTWKSIKDQIDEILENKYKENLNLSNKSEKNPFDLGKPYSIHILSRKLHNKCFICHHSLTSGFGFSVCNGCEFKNNETVLRKNLTKLAYITADWDSRQRFSGFEFMNDSSYEKGQKAQIERQDILDNIFKSNFESKEEVELNCENPECQHPFAIRQQGIKLYPNILLIHLSRFRYFENKLVKMYNEVKYDERLIISGNNYDLYGVVVHSGSSVKGHYFSYVLCNKQWFVCNDQKVQPVTNNEHLNPAAYLLFYKKKDFEPSLKHF